MSEHGLTRTFLPVALAVRGRACLVVGGGVIGSRKVDTLRRFGGVVTVVAPEASAALTHLAEHGEVRWLRQAFREEHLAGMDLVATATGHAEVNAAVVAAAHRRRIPVCDASSAARSDFVFGALLEAGDARVAVFTDGRDPAHARSTRDRIGRQLHAPDALLMGRLTAAATHELRNVLAIVKESAGLIDDVTRLAPAGDAAESKTLRATARIEAQVGRAAELLDALNRLAHGPEGGVGDLPLGLHVREAVTLRRRCAEQQRCSVQVDVGAEEGSVHGGVVDLIGLVAALLDMFLAAAPENSTIRLRTDVLDRRPRLRISVETPDASDTLPPMDPDAAGPWIRALGASVDPGDRPGEIVVSFPSERPALSGPVELDALRTARPG